MYIKEAIITNTERELDAISHSLVLSLSESLKRNPGNGLLLSGGLDTSILAGLASGWYKPECITVALAGAPAPDIEYARQIAELFCLKHNVRFLSEEEMAEGIRATIAILKSFDPMEIRNSSAIYLALKIAREKRLKQVLTGDGGDELFAGYSFFFELRKEQLDTALRNMWRDMRFSSIELANTLGIEARLPFLDPDFKNLAMGIDSGLKVRAEKGKMFGKWILRRAFKDLLPESILWRIKAPVEVGTGTASLPAYFDAKITDGDFDLKKERYLKMDGVKLRSKEHLAYYEIFRNCFGVPGLKGGADRKCPGCQTGVEGETTFCRVCGAYPV